MRVYSVSVQFKQKRDTKYIPPSLDTEQGQILRGLCPLEGHTPMAPLPQRAPLSWISCSSFPCHFVTYPYISKQCMSSFYQFLNFTNATYGIYFHVTSFAQYFFEV